MNKEANIHRELCRWLALAYPRALFNSDMSGVRLPPKLAVQAARLRSSRAMPDLMIFEPRRNYYGLFIELKNADTRLLLKDGTLTRDQHIQEQAAILVELSARNFLATFARGLNEAIELIHWYMDELGKPYPAPDYLTAFLETTVII
jgi:hypothetical protein